MICLIKDHYEGIGPPLIDYLISIKSLAFFSLCQYAMFSMKDLSAYCGNYRINHNSQKILSDLCKQSLYTSFGARRSDLAKRNLVKCQYFLH